MNVCLHACILIRNWRVCVTKERKGRRKKRSSLLSSVSFSLEMGRNGRRREKTRPMLTQTKPWEPSPLAAGTLKRLCQSLSTYTPQRGSNAMYVRTYVLVHKHVYWVTCSNIPPRACAQTQDEQLSHIYNGAATKMIMMRPVRKEGHGGGCCGFNKDRNAEKRECLLLSSFLISSLVTFLYLGATSSNSRFTISQRPSYQTQPRDGRTNGRTEGIEEFLLLPLFSSLLYVVWWGNPYPPSLR